MERARRQIGVDLFCGVGGMSLGFEQAGFDIVAAIDIDPRNVKAHEANFPNCHTINGDLSHLSGDDIRQKASLGDKAIDVLFGGPPCQGFSLIGKRRADDPRNLCLYDFARLVKELSPKYFVMENVSGLLLGNSVTMLESFIRKVNRAGYRTVRPVNALNASQYGVPQKRKRVFVLGFKTGLPMPAYPDLEVETQPTVWDAIGDLPNVDDYECLLNQDVFEGELGVGSPYAQVLRQVRGNSDNRQADESRKSKGLTGCARTSHESDTLSRFDSTLPGSSEPVSRLYRLSKTGLSPTIRAGTGPANGSFMAPRPIHPVYPRCITVREGARLHSFPDWFEFDSTKWHSFRQIGNAVPPLLARAVARSILKALLLAEGKKT